MKYRFKKTVSIKEAIKSHKELTLKLDNMEYEYRIRDWEMWLEGTSDNEPNKEEIIIHAKSKGYKLNDIEIWFDNMQGFWRFSADLVKY